MITVIGLGPGEKSQMTMKALEAIEDSDVVVGYSVYIDLIQELIGEREVIQTPMKQEVERCRLAALAAAEGKKVVLVSSGDAGIYGMAGLTIEVCDELGLSLEIEVIAGITAASSAAAVLGAPLTHDFATISLSNLLTPWDDIERRLDLASQAGFVIAIYNLVSKKRADFLYKACEVLLKNLGPDTRCGYVHNIGRDEQVSKVLTLKELQHETVDMFTTIIIGNGSTKIIGSHLVTPRGYRLESDGFKKS